MIVRRVVEARKQHGPGAETMSQHAPFSPNSKGHTPNVSGAAASSTTYQAPSSMQPSTIPNSLQMQEKSGFDDDNPPVPWWKKLFCCHG